MERPLTESPVAGEYICYECTHLLVHVFDEKRPLTRSLIRRATRALRGTEGQQFWQDHLIQVQSSKSCEVEVSMAIESIPKMPCDWRALSSQGTRSAEAKCDPLARRHRQSAVKSELDLLRTCGRQSVLPNDGARRWFGLQAVGSEEHWRSQWHPGATPIAVSSERATP